MQTGDTTITIKELSPALKQDYLAFFDHDAFSDNPRWASCYCHFNQAAHDTEPWDTRTAAQNRSAVERLIESGEMTGYLAYLGEKPIGWCNANLRARYTTLANPQEPGGEVVGAITCFVIAKPYRARGVATMLLEAACDGLRRRGVGIIEAYPRKDAASEASNYHGPLLMYQRAGFAVVKEIESVIVVRRRENV